MALALTNSPPNLPVLTVSHGAPDTGGMTKPAAAEKPVHIFKPGRWTTMAGETIEFSEADLQATAAAFNPSVSKAPFVLGHPATDDPAQGWVASLQTTTRGLFAVPAQVDPVFAEAVNAGRYGTVSAKFYRPTDASNPVPGVWYLRHVGVLGAKNPALKGLDSPAFAGAEDDGCVSFQEGVAFSGWDDQTNASLWRSLRNWLIGDKGLSVADAVIPPYQVQSLEQAAQDEMREALNEKVVVPEATTWRAALPVNFSDPNPLPEIIVTPAEKAALEARNADLEKQLAQVQSDKDKVQAAQTHAAHVAFCEDLAGQARLLPAQQAVAVAALDHLAAQPALVEFGEGDAKAPLLDGFKAFLAALPAQVTFGESATNERAAGQAAGAADEDAQFSESDPDRLAQHKAVRRYMAEHKVDYATAARAVIK